MVMGPGHFRDRIYHRAMRRDFVIKKKTHLLPGSTAFFSEKKKKVVFKLVGLKSSYTTYLFLKS